VIEDWDEHTGDLTEHHKHEVRETGALLGMCYYLIRGADDAGSRRCSLRPHGRLHIQALRIILEERIRAEERFDRKVRPRGRLGRVGAEKVPEQIDDGD
jgi:hypothetical protein